MNTPTEQIEAELAHLRRQASLVSPPLSLLEAQAYERVVRRIMQLGDQLAASNRAAYSYRAPRRLTAIRYRKRKVPTLTPDAFANAK
jgi:hypothetical protein